MIAGTLLLLEEPADSPLESKASGGFATLDVRETQEYLDDAVVQRGRACDTVETARERIHVDGSEIETETTPESTRVFTEWVADVTDAGFIATKRTQGDEFPMGLFEVASGTEIARACIDPGAFVAAQRSADNNISIWYSGLKDVTADEDAPNDVHMGYGREAGTSAEAERANVGVGYKTSWQGKRIKGIIWASGYTAVFNDSVGPIQFARFVREEIMPHADVVEEDDEESAQETLGGDGFADGVEDHLESEGVDVDRDVRVDGGEE